MGHDIYAYQTAKVASYRRSAFNKDNGRMYELLDCIELNGGVSGIGCYKAIVRDDLMEAEEQALRKGWTYEADFIKETLELAQDTETFLFWFG